MKGLIFFNLILFWSHPERGRRRISRCSLRPVQRLKKVFRYEIRLVCSTFMLTPPWWITVKSSWSYCANFPYQKSFTEITPLSFRSFFSESACACAYLWRFQDLSLKYAWNFYVIIRERVSNFLPYKAVSFIFIVWGWLDNRSTLGYKDFSDRKYIIKDQQF